MNLENSKALAQFGITLKESERYNTVSTLFGNRLAETELQHNLRSYEREFLMDEAVSLPHTYHIRHGQLYSQPTEHDLFNVKKQIDGRERDGATLDGFGKFEQMMDDAPPDTVSLWYSPDGPSGFPGVNFDSGRLYFSYKTDSTSNVNFDIKVRPEFPILPLLSTVNEKISGEHPRFDSPESGKMYYLTHPIQTGMTTGEFLDFMEEYASRESSPVYVSRRNSADPKTRLLSDVMAEMKQLLSSYSEHPLPVFDPSGDRTVGAMMKEEDLMRRYLAVIQPYVENSNGSVTLYGCSTTSTVSRNDIQGVIASHSVDGLISLFSTQHRLQTNRLPPGKEVQKDRYDDYQCPHCNATIQGEQKGKPETWKSECPSCHGKLHCAN